MKEVEEEEEQDKSFLLMPTRFFIFVVEAKSDQFGKKMYELFKIKTTIESKEKNAIDMNNMCLCVVC